jgi:hypothetical protein
MKHQNPNPTDENAMDDSLNTGMQQMDSRQTTPFTDADITVVFQGPVIRGTSSTAELIRQTRQALPRSRYILSTWIGANLSDIKVDQVVLSQDPGGLPSIKYRMAGELNNANRQLLSTRRGLARVKTPYAIKIRTDCALEHAGFRDIFKRFQRENETSRILASSFFTIDPLMFEQMPYHISDWFHFGETQALQTYWSAPFMTKQDATYYEREPYADHSSFMDRRFRTRWAVEQYYALHYAKLKGYPVPTFHNDIYPSVLEGHRRFLARHFVIADPWHIGLQFGKYQWAYRSSFQRLNCLLFVDWYRLYLEEGGAQIETTGMLSASRVRRLQKHAAKALGRWRDKVGPLLALPSARRVVQLILTILAWDTRRSGTTVSPTNWNS